VDLLAGRVVEFVVLIGVGLTSIKPHCVKQLKAKQ
jgi:hypothetical protein